jgi:hypothetical protein
MSRSAGLPATKAHEHPKGGGASQHVSLRCAITVLRPPVTHGALELERIAGGAVLLHIRHPWSDGTRTIALEPLALMARLAALPAAGTQARHKRCWVPWADLLPRVFEIDMLACRSCGGRLRLVATIDDPAVIRRILTHLGIRCSLPTPLPARPPPDMAELPFA